MKKVRLVLFSALLFLCLLSWFVLPNAEASDFLGDVCFMLFSGGKTGILRLGVSDMGGGHFQLNGVVTAEGQEAALIGNAEFLSGNKIDAVLIYSGRGRSGDLVSGTVKLSLDPNTLNGTFSIIELHAIISNPSYQTPTAYTTVGTASLIPCP